MRWCAVHVFSLLLEVACGQCTIVGRAGSAWPVVTVYSSGYKSLL